MPPAGERSHRERTGPALGRGLVILGGLIAIVSVASDALGIGERADVGPRQALAAVIGIVILLCGGLLASSRRSVRFRIAYALFVFGFSLALFAGAEILLRAEADAWPFELPPLPMPYLTAKDEKIAWRMPPGGRNNSLGLRNREIGGKDPSSCRILFLGDSLLYLGDTPSGSTYLQEVEQRLRDAIGERYEIINAGVPGYTTYQEIEFLQAYGYDFQPDVVFLGFVLNDLVQPYLHRPSLGAELALSPEVRLHRFDTHGALGAIFGRSYAAHELVAGYEALSARMSGRPHFPFEYQADVFLAWKDHGWGDTDLLLARLARELDERQIRFYVVVFPLRYQVSPSLLELDREKVLAPQARLRKFLASHGVPMIDAQPVLLEHGGEALFTDHLHLKPEGNEVMADLLSGMMMEETKKWSPPCGR